MSSTFLSDIRWLSQIRIRHLTQDDLQALEWEGEFAHFRRLYREIFQSFLDGKAVMWVVDLPGDGVVGQLFVQFNSARKELADGVSRAYLYGFRVKPVYRGFGIGTLLLKNAEVDLSHRNFEWVTLNVSRQNSGARRFYERNGYRVVAHEPGHWFYLDENGHRHEVYEPAWRMEKRLPGS